MANFSLSRLERLHLQTQPTFTTAPNTAGTMTLSASTACRHIKASLNNETGMLVRKDKTGSRTATKGVAGKQFCNWNLNQSVAPNGTPGVVPDNDPMLRAVFGQAATVLSGTVSIVSSTNASPISVTATGHGLGAAGTLAAVVISGHTVNTAANGVWIASVTDANSFTLLGSTGVGVGGATGSVSKAGVKYAFSDTILQFVMALFRQPSTLNQHYAYGCVVNKITFNLGQDIAELDAEGEGRYVIETDYFSSASTDQLGGLTVAPAEPSNPVTNGGVIAGFTGRFVADGKTITAIRSASVSIQPGNVVIKDNFGSYLPDSTEGDERTVLLNASMYEDDSAGQQNLRIYAQTKNSFDVVLQVGTVVGSTMLILLRGVQIPKYMLEDGQRRFVANMSDCRAYGTTITALDECAIWFV